MEQTPQRITCSLLNCTRAAVHGLDVILGAGDLVCSELTPHPESQLWSDNIQKTDMAVLFMLWRRTTKFGRQRCSEGQIMFLRL